MAVSVIPSTITFNFFWLWIDSIWVTVFFRLIGRKKRASLNYQNFSIREFEWNFKVAEKVSVGFSYKSKCSVRKNAPSFNSTRFWHASVFCKTRSSKIISRVLLYGQSLLIFQLSWEKTLSLHCQQARLSGNKYLSWPCMYNMCPEAGCFIPRGDTPDFKWRGWSNGGKNQNPKKSLDQKLTSKKNPMAKFRALNISRKLKWYSTLCFIWL